MYSSHKSSSGGQEAAEAARRLRQSSSLEPRLGMILGSGFGNVASAMQIAATVPYGSLPGMPPATVTGHDGVAIIGTIAEIPILVLKGRAHYYEGHSMSAVTFGVRLLFQCGVRDLLLTNAAGGLNPTLQKGDLMVIRDHINFMGANPLRGQEGGDARFVDLTRAYDPSLSDLLTQAGATTGARVHSGVYLAVSGPSYETPAEIRAFAKLGADAVGMSTVPEVVVARFLGMRVAGLSCITNVAAGLSEAPLAHEEVLEAGKAIAGPATALVAAFVRAYGAKVKG